MKDSENIWGIKEFEGDGANCPIIPVNLPWYKKVFLTFFRFGLCPVCITMSLVYSLKSLFTRRKIGLQPAGTKTLSPQGDFLATAGIKRDNITSETIE